MISSRLTSASALSSFFLLISPCLRVCGLRVEPAASAVQLSGASVLSSLVLVISACLRAHVCQLLHAPIAIRSAANGRGWHHAEQQHPTAVQCRARRQQLIQTTGALHLVVHGWKAAPFGDLLLASDLAGALALLPFPFPHTVHRLLPLARHAARLELLLLRTAVTTSQQR